MEMCGRYTLAVDAELLRSYFHVREPGFDHARRYNIAPGQAVPVVLAEGGERKLSLMRWGLVPRWAKGISTGNKMINARAETVAQKPAFREVFSRRRCLVPADGFYEWRREGNRKQPLRIVIAQPLFAFAGIWERWISPAGDSLLSFSIITTAANAFMREIHPRMPVILAGEQEQSAWLEPGPPGDLMQLLRPYEGEMTAYRVSTVVNSPQHDYPHCIARID